MDGYVPQNWKSEKNLSKLQEITRNADVQRPSFTPVLFENIIIKSKTFKSLKNCFLSTGFLGGRRNFRRWNRSTWEPGWSPMSLLPEVDLEVRGRRTQQPRLWHKLEGDFRQSFSSKEKLFGSIFERKLLRILNLFIWEMKEWSYSPTTTFSRLVLWSHF